MITCWDIHRFCINVFSVTTFVILFTLQSVFHDALKISFSYIEPTNKHIRCVIIFVVITTKRVKRREGEESL